MDPTEKKGVEGKGRKRKRHTEMGGGYSHILKKAVPTTLYILNAFLLSSCLPLLLLLLWHVGYIADVCVYVYVYAYVLCLLYL